MSELRTGNLGSQVITASHFKGFAIEAAVQFAWSWLGNES